MYGGSKIETETTATAYRSGLGLVGIWKYMSLPRRQTSACIQALVQSSTQRHSTKSSRSHGMIQTRRLYELNTYQISQQSSRL
jgi:hypothetical protein